MLIWVDADACPNVIKTILYRAAQRTGIMTFFVANRYLILPNSPYLRAIQVENGFDVADRYITEQVTNQDLVITADIPLAANVIDKGASALNPRGQFYTDKNIREILNMRDMMMSLRESGTAISGPASLTHTDRQTFANQLDQWLARSQAIDVRS